MITRRNILQAGALSAAAGIVRGSAMPASKKHVLFLVVDDLNDWVGCLGGHPQAQTPNLDKLAARGMLFTNAHCAAPLCNPSRTAVMFGIRPSTSGVYQNDQPYREAPALKNAVSLAEHFRHNGYRSLGCGKIYHRTFTDPRSWDEYHRPDGTEPKPPKGSGHGIAGLSLEWAPLDVADGEMTDTKVADWAASQLSAKQSKPLFLACGIYKPHLPWHVPKKYFDRFPLSGIKLPDTRPDDLKDVPDIGKRIADTEYDHTKVVEHGKWKEAVQAYLASMSFADECAGRVLRALEIGPNANDTVVVLWSDHGWHLGEKLHWRKFTLWEEATRNILAISAPGLTKPSQRCDRAVSLLDVYPTLIDICGLTRQSGLEGTSVAPQLKNPQAGRSTPAITTYLQGNHSIRNNRWRYIRYNDGTEELYDHRSDPNEWTNLAGKADSREKQELARWLPRHNEPPSLDIAKKTGRSETSYKPWDRVTTP
jgi:arylsulfatase A-like enzyme